MRKIILVEEKMKKESRNKLIIGLVLVAIMVLSTAGYSFFSVSKEETKKIEYNGAEFILNDAGMWQFKIQNFDFSTQYNPEETENISVIALATINNYIGKPLFFSGEETAAKQEVARNLLNFASRMQDVCIEEDKDCDKTLPIKNCSQDNIIIFQEEKFIDIGEEENCIFISAPYDEQIRTADSFLFKILGVRNF